VRFHRLVETSAAVAATRSRNAKVSLLAGTLADADATELPAVVAFLSGQPTQDRLELGWAAIRDVQPDPAAESRLSVAEVDAAFGRIADASGSGSRGTRTDAFAGLLAAATPDEQDHLRGLVMRELRQGASEGLVVLAVAEAEEVPVAAVRRAAMLAGSLPAVAVLARSGGHEALAAVRLEVGRPVRPMLASTAPDVATVVAELGTVVVDTKLDGARVQVHRDGDAVRVFTRNLREVTDRVPEVVAAVGALDASRVVLDGEAIALDDDGRPRPFQETMSRFGREDGAANATEVPLTVSFFDVLHVDGDDVLDAPLAERLDALDRVVPASLRVDRAVTADPERALDVLRAALGAGHEGVMLKDPAAPYAAGRRGAAWRKVKPVHTLDLVVLAVEWGSGRRRGWLSNLHLGAHDPETDRFVMLGKTFKGLTDEMLAWQTERLLELEVRRTARVVHVHPELVVEIAFDGVQASSRYPGGVALRFARVKGYRPDKDPREADTIATVQAIHRGERLPQL
jgi:DNA ligase-1